MANNIQHVGVLGMRWGIRKGSSTSGGSAGSAPKIGKREKLLLEAFSKKKIRTDAKVLEMDSKALSDLASSPAMKKKLTAYKKRKDAKVARTVALCIFGLSVFGPSIMRAGGKTLQFARDTRFDYLANKYGGFDPEKVINATFK